MKILGQEIIHKKFGSGVITHVTEDKVTIKFGENEKLFLFPDVFGKYAVLKDESEQKRLEELYETSLKAKRQEQEKVNLKQEYRNRIYIMKIHQRSQAVFDISQEKISNINKLDFLDTGCYLSGLRKGKPRVPSALQPNSGILLTKCDNGSAEIQRKIIGVVMADDTFWGNECVDGHIRLHKKYMLILPEESWLSFWDIYKQEPIPSVWGNVAFKYFSNKIMQNIMQEIQKRTIGTELENEAEEFYQYFCKLNRLQ